MSYTPQQNGTAERDNRTIVETARTKLQDTAVFEGKHRMTFGLVSLGVLVNSTFLEAVYMRMFLINYVKNGTQRVNVEFSLDTEKMDTVSVSTGLL